ncbi:MAG: DNA polymerase III subunit alpha [Fimbriimonas sp.]
MIDVFRQTGRWWLHEPESEYQIYIDSKGVRREVVAPINENCTYRDHFASNTPRVLKVRDEKVARACGLVPDVNLVAIFKNKLLEPSALGCLHVLSGYSFGQSTMLAEEIPYLAADRGYSSVLLADHFSLTGAYEFSKACWEVGIKPLIGATVETVEGGPLVLVARSRLGYQSLSNLLTDCHLCEPRLFPLARDEYLQQHTQDLVCLTGGSSSHLNYLLGTRNYKAAEDWLKILTYRYSHVFVQIERSFLPGELRINRDLSELANSLNLPCVAGGPKTHPNPAHFPVLDVITCASFLSTIESTEERKPMRNTSQPRGRTVPRRQLNSERYIRDVSALSELYADCPDLLVNTSVLSDLCDDIVLPSRTNLPAQNQNESSHFREVVLSRLSKDAPAGLIRRTKHEVNRIIKLGFAGHFLVAADMCDWARSKSIHFSARGSVVDSVVAYHLGFSRINAWEHKLHFDRFLPADGTKRPDIDIDFEAFRRDEVRSYLSNKYGNKHVATVAAVGAYTTRGIIREVGKVMELPDETISYLAKKLHRGVSADQLEKSLETRPELRDSGIEKERFRWVIRLAKQITDIPRNMRSHSSGVVISSEPLSNTVPLQYSGVEGVQIIQWDKRSAKHCFDKFDLLCLRGQDVLSDTEEQIRRVELGFTMSTVPIDDESSYFAMRQGYLIGIPQSASPAMRQAHVRMKTRSLADASIVQAGIRPGVGGAVKLNEMIARRQGKPYRFDHPLLERILGNTYGIIVFQEQVDQLLQEFGGYSSGEAEDTRESIYKKRREEFAQSIRQEVLKRIVNRGFAQVIAEQVYDLVSGFNGYGFAQGHALAFAEISLRCICLQQNYPSQYFSALLNSQPAGYYGPATIVNEARSRGVTILPPCVNTSTDNYFADNDLRESIRVGLNQVQGLSKELVYRIVDNRPFADFYQFVKVIKPNRNELETLILSGCLDELHANRRELMWCVPKALDWARAQPSLLPMEFVSPDIDIQTRDFSEIEKAIHERRYLGIDVCQHLVSYERSRITSKGGLTNQEIQSLPSGQKAFSVGNPIRLRFPPTKSGKRVVFFDLEDETGLLNVTCFDDVYLRDGHAIICSPYVTVVGETQIRDGHMAFLASRVFPYKPQVSNENHGNPLPVMSADYLVG